MTDWISWAELLHNLLGILGALLIVAGIVLVGAFIGGLLIAGWNTLRKWKDLGFGG